MENKKVTLKQMNEQIDTIRLLIHGRVTRDNINYLNSELTAIEDCCRLCRGLLYEYIAQETCTE